jgi:pimeloyl-ACP methyl ester carboxylesterase
LQSQVPVRVLVHEVARALGAGRGAGCGQSRASLAVARVLSLSSSAVVARHRAAGREFEAGGVQSFVRDEGSGQPVVCVHGVPASCFVYRKMITELAGLGLRGVAFDLPGMGLAARPFDFDYTWTGLGRFAAAAVDSLALGRFHLVVHDIGGPVGFELAATMPEGVLSMTLLNTVIEVESFRRPWMMEMYARRHVGELWLAATNNLTFRALMFHAGIADRRATPGEELDAYVELLKRVDGGRAFLKIMRGFERTSEKQRLYERVVRDARYPVQIVWSARDPALRLAVQGAQAQRATGVGAIQTVPGKHFPQEDHAGELARHVAALAGNPASSH